MRRLFNKTICSFEHFDHLDHLDHFIVQYHTLGKTNQRRWISATMDSKENMTIIYHFIAVIWKSFSWKYSLLYFSMFFFSRSALSWHSCTCGLKLHGSFAKHATIIIFLKCCFFIEIVHISSLKRLPLHKIILYVPFQNSPILILQNELQCAF